jgi:thymidylate kinase
VKDEILPRTIGIDGPDAVNKSRFSVLAARALREQGQKVFLCTLPFPRTLSGGWIMNSDRCSFPMQVMPPLYASDRLELLSPIKYWLGRGVDHWTVLDRTKMSGVIYGVAQGFDRGWLEALDEKFPSIALGLYLSRPVEESVAIMKERGDVTGMKAELDRNIHIQTVVRTEFDGIVDANPNWHKIDVSGLASDYKEFREWETRVGLRVWNVICRELGREGWLRDAEALIKKLRVGIETHALSIELLESYRIYSQYWRERKSTGVERDLFIE